jgi:hypothetical protein
VVNIIHEMGSPPEDVATQRTLFIPPSDLPTLVQIKSAVVAGGASALDSPPYLAAVRRREARALAERVRGLEQSANREDFSTCTFPIVNQLNSLLKTLAQTETEGNTREVLREIRSTILNRGWERYRSPDVRNLIVAILGHLADAEEVSAKDAHATFDKLSRLNLDSIGVPIFDFSDEAEDV